MQNHAKTIIKIAGLSIFFLLIVVYALFRSKDLILGVKIQNVKINGSPMQSGATLASNVVEITGIAKHAVYLSLDGREISVDQLGDFDETIALLPGYNIINIKCLSKRRNTSR